MLPDKGSTILTAHEIASQFERANVVQQAVTDGIGQDWVADGWLPTFIGIASLAAYVPLWFYSRKRYLKNTSPPGKKPFKSLQDAV